MRPWEKYEAFTGPSLPDRQWPSNKIREAPRWLATDLRDGNQSLASPMTGSQKLTYFNMLVELGYKEIEVSTPTASFTEYDFTRQLIETPDAVPDDVWLQVLCPCRLDLIQRTLDTVFQMSKQDVFNRVVEAVTYARSITKDDEAQKGTTWNLMFSPEAFSGSDMAFCLRLCEKAKEIWEPSVEVPIILNLPATVEMSTPNVFADQVEIFCRSISEREKVCVSLHVHNDRGCAVASAELGLMAGAQRIEGCLFGNGERSGNVDLVTLALNLYTQGIDPRVDFSNLASIRKAVEELTCIPVHPRAPYTGDLFFAAYSGAHQDAIHKGLVRYRAETGLWKVPYLSMDPEDLGLSRMDIIRLNSQSGKGGVAWILFQELHITIPKGLQFNFSKVVKMASDTIRGTLSPSSVVHLFLSHYFIMEKDPRILSAEMKERPNRRTPPADSQEDGELLEIDALIEIQATQLRLRGTGRDLASALENALRPTFIGEVTLESSICLPESPQEGLEALAVVECRPSKGIKSGWGVRSTSYTSGSNVPELMAALSSVLDLYESERTGA
ncbi:hypothetical protein GGS20DRAFT_596115 [Poronia punctata]|nr:hypothetical protein GGS20DRAFT_596115 [Poronia punctata]